METAVHIRSAKNKETGVFTVTVWDWNGAEFFKGCFFDLAEAEAAAQTQERRMTIAMQSPSQSPLTMAELLMSDDELLAELTA
jgi:hypothetical protein